MEADDAKRIAAKAALKFVKASTVMTSVRRTCLRGPTDLTGEGRDRRQGTTIPGRQEVAADFDHHLVDALNPIAGTVFNDVAISVLSRSGSTESLPSSIGQGSGDVHSVSLSLDDACNLDGERCPTRARLQRCGLRIDGASGKVVN